MRPLSVKSAYSTTIVAELNARMDRLPTWGFGPIIFLLVGGSYFFTFYDITSIGVALPTLVHVFHLTSSQIALPITANLIAYMVGAYGLGTLADYLGRRKALAISLIILGIGSLLTAFAWSLDSLTVFRALIGLGMGAQISLASTIMSELAPARLRGKAISFNLVAAGIGLGVAPFLGLALLGGANGWRYVLGLGTVALILLVFVSNRLFPESPRWLAIHDQAGEADRVVQHMERLVEQKTGTTLPPVPNEPSEPVLSKFPTSELLHKPYLRRLIMVFLYWFFKYTGGYAYLAFAPTLLILMGLSEPKGLLFTAIGGIMFPIGALMGSFMTDRWQRKYLVAIGESVGIVGMVILAFSHTSLEVIIGELIAGFWVFFSVSFSYPYTAEVFPTRARATGMAVGDGLGHLGAAIQPLIVVALIATVGARMTWWFVALMLALAVAVILFGGLPTKTKGEGLTELSR